MNKCLVVACAAQAKDDPRELIDGRLEETEVPTKLHEWVVACLVAALFTWARANKAGTVLPSDYKLRISRTRGVMADVVFIRRGRGHLAKNEGMRDAAPDLSPPAPACTTFTGTTGVPLPTR